MNIDKEVLETAKKVLKAYTPETLNGALGYIAFMAPFERLPDEVKARMTAEVQKEIDKRAKKVFEEES